jgi:hypothetical protein
MEGDRTDEYVNKACNGGLPQRRSPSRVGRIEAAYWAWIDKKN